MSELVSLDDAFAAAADESGSAGSPPVDEILEGADEQASDELFNEQATTEDSLDDVEVDEVEELFDDEDLGEDPEDGQAEITEAALQGMSFELPGIDEPVSFTELRDGYLRQADATKKWQAVAEERKANERAWKLYEAIQADPLAVARQIAEETGLIEAGSKPAKAVDFSVFNTAEAVEAEIQKRVEEQIAQHPSVVEANKVAAREWVSSEFARIEESLGVTLGPKSRHAVLEKAAQAGIGDLEIVVTSMLAQKQRRSEETQRLKSAAPGRPKGSKAKGHVDEVAEVKSLDDAFELALAGVE